MSKNSKIVLGILVVIALALAVFAMSEKTEAPVGSTSDESLTEDAAALDAELEGLEDDSALIDEGLNEDI